MADPQSRRNELEAELRVVRVDLSRARQALEQEQRRNAALEDELASARGQAHALRAGAESARAERDALAQQAQEAHTMANEAEQQRLAAHRAMEGARLERDSAIVAKEDLSSQLRVLRRRLQDAEEEQDKADETIAALESEVKSLQMQLDMAGDLGGAEGALPPELRERLEAAEREKEAVQGQLEQALKALARERAQGEQAQRELERERAQGEQAHKDLERERALRDGAVAAARREAEAKEEARAEAEAEAEAKAETASGTAVDVERLEVQVLELERARGEWASQVAAMERRLQEQEETLREQQEALRDGEEAQEQLERELTQLRSALQVKKSGEGSLFQIEPVSPSQAAQPEGATKEQEQQQEQGQQQQQQEQGQLHEEQGQLCAQVERLQQQLGQVEARAEQIEKAAAASVVAIEKLRAGRVKLLSEVDTQSAQIERLFQENSGLAAAVRETSAISTRWEAQLECSLGANEELRANTEELRRQHAQLVLAQAQLRTQLQQQRGQGPVPGSREGVSEEEENTQLKAQLLAAQSQLEELQASLLRTKADYTGAVQRLASLRRLYKPVLSNIEYKLLQCKQEMSSSSHVW